MRITIGGVFLLASSIAWANSYGKLPLSFEANHGQTDSRVKFLSRGHERTLFLTSTEAVLRTASGVVRIKLEGANPSPRVSGLDKLPGKSNYFIGNDPAKWRTNVPTFAKVRYENVYSGIDLVYYANGNDLEYDFVVAPGADPRAIRFTLGGSAALNLEGSGDLIAGGMRLHRPVVYQQIDGGRKVIDGRFVVHARHVRFDLARYDRTKPLIIDPVLVYASYLGGSGGDSGYGIAVDSSGNAYVTGTTESMDFPTSNPYQGSNNEGGPAGGSTGDAFVSKISADGSTLIYSTYLGGTGFDQGNGIAVDAAGDAYVAGETTSTDFPLANAFESSNQDPSGVAFVTKLNPSGSVLLFSTYLGGRGGGPGGASAIALDSSGNAYITGADSSTGDFPLMNPIEGYNSKSAGTGTFVTEMSADGSALVYSTFIGGYNGQNTANGIAVDAAGAAYVAGETTAPDFPTVNPIQAANNGDNAFVLKINPGGSALSYATVLGGTSLKSAAYAIAVDSAGNAYITGTTRDTDFPVTANPYESSPSGGAAFVSKITPSGGSLVYSTYLGNADDDGYGIAVDSAGHAWVTGNGHVQSVNALPFAQYSTGFVCEFSADGSSLLFSSEVYLTGELAASIALDASGNAYLTGTVEPNGLASPSGFESTFGGGESDAVVVKIGTVGPALPAIAANGVVNGASFQPGLVVGSWATVTGSNLSSVTDTWDNFIVNGQLPTMVDNVSVTVGGNDAYVYYVSPTQINFIVPEVPAGSQQVTVTNSAGASAAETTTVAEFAPAFFAWPNNQVVATFQNFSYAAASGTFSGVTTTPAKPGDTIILWGTGFGPTEPAFPQGMVTPSNTTYNTSSLPTVTVNNVSATVYGAALAPEFAGLYQVAIQVPSSLGAGNWPVVATIGGVSSPSNLVLAVQ